MVGFLPIQVHVFDSRFTKILLTPPNPPTPVATQAVSFIQVVIIKSLAAEDMSQEILSKKPSGRVQAVKIQAVSVARS